MNNCNSSRSSSKIRNNNTNTQNKHIYNMINSNSEDDVKHQSSDDSNTNNKILNKIERVKNQQGETINNKYKKKQKKTTGTSNDKR